MRTAGKCLLIGWLLALACTASSSGTQDGISLTVSFDRASGQVTLQWAGGQAPWTVFRAIEAVSIDDPASELGQAMTSSWIDSPPSAQILFYRVQACALPSAPQPRGCTTCSCCDVWSIHWDPVDCATHYVVRWGCGTQTGVWNVGNATSVADLCEDIGMCDACSFGVSYLRVEACNALGCSSPADVPASERPTSCGGGCCC